MAHNWTTKTLIDFPPATSVYAVVTGDDSFGDGSPDTPYRSINQSSFSSPGIAKKIVWGTGGSSGSITTIQDSIHGEEGKAKQSVIDLDGGVLTMQGISGVALSNLTVMNGTITIDPTCTISNVIFIDCNFSAPFGYALNFNDCIFINTNFSDGSSFIACYFITCMFFNSTVYNKAPAYANYGCARLQSCYVDTYSRIQMTSFYDFEYNDFEGQIMLQNGANPFVYLTLEQAMLDYPSQIGTTSINQPPLFADVSKMAFNVSGASPLLGTSKTGGNIGNAMRADVYFCDVHPELTDVGLGGDAVITNLDGTTDKTVNTAFPDGTFITGVITVDSMTVSILGSIGYIGKYALDSSLGGLSNDQVPDSFDYVDGTSGNTPDNLTYRMRWATGSTPPTRTTGWYNGGLTPADSYSTFVWNIQPKIDGTFLGNGDPDYDSTNSNVLGVKWIQIFGKLVKNTWNNV